MKLTIGRDAWIVLTIFAVIIVGGLLGGPIAKLNSSAHTEHAFAPGGTVTLELEAGDYTIVSGSDDKIVVDAESRHGRYREVQTAVEVSGNTAHVTTHTPDNSDVSVRIELPSRSHIDLRLTAGDLKIRGLEGNKDIESKAGDVDVEVGDPNKYGNVEASSLAGDITASPFGRNSSGIGNSFSWTGSGPYHLRVHMLAGDLRLH
jgi:putative adhesin